MSLIKKNIGKSSKSSYWKDKNNFIYQIVRIAINRYFHHILHPYLYSLRPFVPNRLWMVCFFISLYFSARPSFPACLKRVLEYDYNLNFIILSFIVLTPSQPIFTIITINSCKWCVRIVLCYGYYYGWGRDDNEKFYSKDNTFTKRDINHNNAFNDFN